MKGFFSKSELPQVKPDSLVPKCGACGLLKGCHSPKMEPSGEGRRKILIVGEAPGETEDLKGLQFVGTSGKLLERALAKFEVDMRKDCWITNALACFVSPKVRIYTSEGYKWISKIQVGDLVLTHQGRFRRVVSRSMDLPSDLRINKGCLVDINVGVIKLTVTEDHLFLTKKGWRRADLLRKNDKIKVLGAKCIVCGKVYHKKNPNTFDQAMSFCSYRCHNKWVGERNGPAISKSMKDQYTLGVRDAIAITREANKKYTELMKTGWRAADFVTLEGKKCGRKRTAKTRQRWNGFYDNPIVGHGEEELAAWLVRKGIRYCHQYAIKSRSFDFYLPKYKMLIEVENPNSWAPNKRIKRNKYAIKRRLAKQSNRRLIFLKSREPWQELERILKNDNHEYHFVYAPVKDIKIRPPRRREKLYCLEVEDDSSYISTGIVSHNCRPEGNVIGDERRIDYCRPLVTKAIKEFDPEVVILLGGSAVKSVIGGIWKKEAYSISRWAGWTIPNQRPNCWIVPTYHPDDLLRVNDPVLQLHFENHLKAAVELEGRPWRKVPDYDSQVDVILEPDQAATRLEELLHNSDMVAFDYETDRLKPDREDSRIVSCSVSNGKVAISYPWFGKVVKATQDMTRSPIRKIAANAKFEQRWTKRIFGHGVRSWFWDTVLAAHVLDNRQRVAGLKFQAYVLLGQPSYDDHIRPFLRSKSGNSNDPNQIKSANLEDVLLYGALDSLLEYKVAKKQMKLFGIGKDTQNDGPQHQHSK